MRKTRYFDYTVTNKSRTTPLPARKTARSAGYDFILPMDVEIPPQSFSDIIWTGVKAIMPPDEYLSLNIRSSYAIKYGLTLANCVGIIDSDYSGNPDNDGNIGAKLFNHTDRTVKLKKGQAFMQGIFCKYAITDDDAATETRIGGIGSTGK